MKELEGKHEMQDCVRDKSGKKKLVGKKSHLTYFWWAIFQTGGIFFLPPGKILVGNLTGYSSSRKKHAKIRKSKLLLKKAIFLKWYYKIKCMIQLSTNSREYKLFIYH